MTGLVLIHAKMTETVVLVMVLMTLGTIETPAHVDALDHLRTSVQDVGSELAYVTSQAKGTVLLGGNSVIRVGARTILLPCVVPRTNRVVDAQIPEAPALTDSKIGPDTHRETPKIHRGGIKILPTKTKAKTMASKARIKASP